MNLTKSKTAKFVVGFVGVMLALWLIAPVSARAQTVAELQAQIAALLAQVAQLQTLLGGGSTGGSAPVPPLTMGSTGSEVVKLQQVLVSKGFLTMPAGVAMGTFGPLTKAALAAWQAANGVSPAVGYYGSISAGVMTSQMTTTLPPPVPGPLPLPIPLPGVSDGVLVSTQLALESSPANGTDLKKGDTNIGIVRWKVRTAGSDGVLKQWGIKATHRPWLYWNAARVVDSSGTVVAEKTGLTSADFSEVTAGSDYRLVFAGLNYAISKNTDNFLTLQVSSPSNNDKSASSGLVITQASNSVVVADANDNYTVSDGVTSNRTYDFIAGSTGNIVPSNNTATPGSRWVKVSGQGTTPNVTLHVFDLKAESRAVELNTLLNDIWSGGEDIRVGNAAGMIDSYDLYEGSCPIDGSTAGCTLLAGGSAGDESSVLSTTTFSSMHANIPVGTRKTFTLKAMLADNDDFTADSGSGASSTIKAIAAYLGGIDANFDTSTVSGSNITGGDIHAILVAPTLSNTSAVGTVGSIEYLASLTFKYSLTSDGGALYMSKAPGIALATSTTASNTVDNGYTALPNVIGSTCSSCGDTAVHFVIPDGVTRTFTYTGTMNNRLGAIGAKNFKITKIYFDDDTTGLQEFWFDTSFTGMSDLSKDVVLSDVDYN